MRHSVVSRQRWAAGRILIALSMVAVCGSQVDRAASIRLHGQAAPAAGERQTFDVVEIRHSAAAPGSPPRLRPLAGGRVEMRGYTLWELMRVVYGHETYRTPRQVIDGPTWLDVQRFDVDATGAGDLAAFGTSSEPPPVLVDRMRAMLEDQFDLRVRTARQEQDIFVLTRPGAGAPGAQMTSRADCRPSGAAAPRDTCDLVTLASGVLFGWALSMDRLAYILSTLPDAGRVVQNETGLAGRFDLKITWRSGADIGSGSDLSTALEQQLGLRLEPARGPVDALIVERVRLP